MRKHYALSKFSINVRVSDQHKCHLLGLPWYQTTMLSTLPERAPSADSQLQDTFSLYYCGCLSAGLSL